MVTTIKGNQIPIYLKKMDNSHTDLIIQWRNSEVVRPYFIYQEPFTVEGHRKWVETMIDSGRGFQFMICEVDTDKPIGCTYLRDYDATHNHAEFGIFIGVSLAHGKGIGSNATCLTLQFAFEQLKLHKIHARALATNQPSNQMFTRLGFTREGVLRDHVMLQDEYQTVNLYGLLESEYTQIDGYQEA